MKELIVIIGLLVAITFFGRLYTNSRIEDRALRKVFMSALYFKLLCVLINAILYKFYYKGGDSLGYFRNASIYYEAFLYHPEQLLSLFKVGGEVFKGTFESEVQFQIQSYIRMVPANLFVVQIAAILGLLTLNTFIGTSLLFSLISFVGTWLFSKVIYERYQSIKGVLLLMFVPTFTFWSASISKEGLAIGALGLLFYLSYQMIEKRRFKFSSFIWLALAIVSLAIVKTYILLVFVMSFVVYLLSHYLHGVKGYKLEKVLLAPILLAVFGMLIFLVSSWASEHNDRYDLTAIDQNIKYIQSYHVGVSDEGKSYDLGLSENPELEEIFLAVPNALFVSFYRPFIWEARDWTLLLYGFENLSILILSLMLIYNMLLGRLKLSYLSKDSLFISSVLFVLLFACVIGFTSYNFGALSRYRIPLVPYLIIIIIGITNSLNTSKLNR